MKRNYKYTTISIKKDTSIILKDVKRYLEEDKKRFVSMDEAIYWLLKKAGFLY